LEKKKEKMMIIKRKKDLIESKEEIMIKMKSKRTTNMIDSRNEMKETDGMSVLMFYCMNL
jgi:hypothetical protein